MLDTSQFSLIYYQALEFMASLSEGQVLPKPMIVAFENLLCPSSRYVLSARLFQRIAVRMTLNLGNAHCAHSV